MRDWVYGSDLPPRLHRRATGDRPTRRLRAGRRPRHDERRCLPGRLQHRARRRHGQRLQRPDHPRRRRHLAHHLLAARSGPATRWSASPSSTINDLIRELAAAQRHRAERHPRGRRGRQHDHDPPVAGPRPQVPPRGALRPHRWPRRRSSSPASSASRQPAGARALSALAWAATWAATSRPASSRSGMFATERLTLFIDVGTNGEIVLGNKDWLIACACSAGPAFEGGERRPRHARQHGRHRGRVDQRRDLRADLPHHRRRPPAGHLRLRAHRRCWPSCSSPVSSTRAAASSAPPPASRRGCARASTAASTSSPGRPRRASATTSCSPRATSTT